MNNDTLLLPIHFVAKCSFACYTSRSWLGGANAERANVASTLLPLPTAVLLAERRDELQIRQT